MLKSEMLKNAQRVTAIHLMFGPFRFCSTVLKAYLEQWTSLPLPSMTNDKQTVLP